MSNLDFTEVEEAIKRSSRIRNALQEIGRMKVRLAELETELNGLKELEQKQSR